MDHVHLTIMGICSLITASDACSPGKNPSAGSSADHPNIVLIFADDMGYGDLSCYGAVRYKTPNIDRLAAEGMRLTSFYVAQAVCSASRAALLTGCYSNRVGIGGALNHTARIGINPEEETIAEVLKKSNYKNAVIGKWHLGHLEPFLPLQHGFDHYFGLPYSNDMWPVNYDGSPVTEEKNDRKIMYPVLPLIRDNECIREIKTLRDQAELTNLYTEEAVKFINENKGNPFFLYLAHSMPHVPLAVSDKFRGKSEQGLYGDVLMEIDWSVGRIMEVLSKNGILENTLIIFTSDNGPWLNFGNHAGSAGGLREGKGTSWEGGQKVPCIMKWPGHIPEGSVCNKLASTIDILPTLAEITGSGLPEKKIDGISILPLLLGDETADPREVFYYYYQFDCLEAIQKNHWKLVFPHKSRTYEGFSPGMDGQSGKTGMVETGYGLYDLRRDPGERYDLKEYFPEILEDLKKEADEARKDLGDGLLKIKGANVREPGKIENHGL